LVHVFVGGSALHGAKVKDTDDLDIYGLYIEPPNNVIGLFPDEHFVWSTSGNEKRNGPEDVDITLYGLRKWAGMVAKGNPTALNFLFSPYHDEYLTSGTEWWRIRLGVLRTVIAKSAASQFKGFVDAQLGRLLGTRGLGKHGQRPELEANFGYDVKAGMHCVRLLSECIELMYTGAMTFPRPDKETLIEIRTGKWSLDRLSSYVNQLFEMLDKAVEVSELPEKADRVGLSKVIYEAYLRHWKTLDFIG
jgi:predicted nucleotidyltransferase